MMPEDLSIEEIVDVLDRYRVRATYGAVAAYVGKPATFLMTNLERAPRYSWIVNQETLQPTGYDTSQKHPDLEQNRMVLRSDRKLRDWLQRKAAQAARAKGNR
jgi:hypothetical protein